MGYFYRVYQFFKFQNYFYYKLLINRNTRCQYIYKLFSEVSIDFHPKNQYLLIYFYFSQLIKKYYLKNIDKLLRLVS